MEQLGYVLFLQASFHSISEPCLPPMPRAAMACMQARTQRSINLECRPVLLPCTAFNATAEPAPRSQPSTSQSCHAQDLNPVPFPLIAANCAGEEHVLHSMSGSSSCAATCMQTMSRTMTSGNTY